MTTAIIGRQIPTVMTKAMDSTAPTVQSLWDSNIETLKHWNGSNDNFSVRLWHGMLCLCQKYPEIDETQNINRQTHTERGKNPSANMKTVSSGGKALKTKGNLGRGGYGGGSLEAGKGHRRGEPYNFAKPQAAQNSKPQPCAASFSIFASFCFQVSSLMFKPQILEILIANLKYTCRHSFMICINRLVLTFWLFNLTI